jgi:protein-tyrosine phosphatase
MLVVRILFVCMGNICRSPTAEGVFRALAGRDAPERDLEVDSAATHGYHVGHAPDARAQRVAHARGVDLSGLRARQLTPADFDAFDLILVMDQDNLEFTTAMAPPGRRERIRLLLDFAPSQPLREVFDLAEQAARGLLESLPQDSSLSLPADAARARH